jgi:undecaprenyl diphosphate synthase
MGLHIGCILDGNRRYADKLGLPRLIGHTRGAENLINLMKGIKKLINENSRYNITEASLYVLSMQNLLRSEEELTWLADLFCNSFKKILDHKEFLEGGIQVNFFGRTHLLRQDVQDMIEKVREKTKDNSKFKLNFCIAYGGQEEIVDAVNKVIKSGKSEVSKEEFEDYLYSKNYPDIIIRTGDSIRTSNFLMWQSAYSEWFFLKKSWPEFNIDDLRDIMDEFFDVRKRRFGK